MWILGLIESWLQRVINIHSDFHDAVLSGTTHKHDSNVVTAPSSNKPGVLQDKTALNVMDGTSTDGDSEYSEEEEQWEPKKATKTTSPIKAKAMAKRKTGKAPQKNVASRPEEMPPPELVHLNLRTVLSAASTRTSETTSDIDDPSDRSTIRSNCGVTDQSSPSSSRPVLRQRRHGKKIIASSSSSDSDEDEAFEKDSFVESDSGMADSPGPAILEGLNKLSIDSDTGDHCLSNLLALCEQDSAHNFTSFIDNHHIALTSAPTRIKTRGKRAASATVQPNIFQKIGEASYSEVFGVWSGISTCMNESPRVVMKVVPLDMQPTKTISAGSTRHGDDAEDDEVCLTKSEDIAKEIQITRLMNGVHEGFVKLHE